MKVPCASIDEVFRTTSAGAADFGVVPVENSTEGVVARSLDLFLTEPLFIIGETSLAVRQNLLRKENSLSGIEAVALPGDRETKNLFERAGLTARKITVYKSLVARDDV